MNLSMIRVFFLHMLWVIGVWGGVCGATGVAAPAPSEEPRPMHTTARKQYWDRKNDTVELVGDAWFHMPGESIHADRILVDRRNRIVRAFGSAEYDSGETVIQAREMRFDLDTRTGTVWAGRVTNGQFLLVGEEIRIIGKNQFQTEDAEYTTCHDCPGSWSFHAQSVDMELEGYAFLRNVTGKVMGAPVTWFPYLIVPVKTQRQTGLLFPRMGLSSDHGFQFTLPFFWAINRSADMTFALGGFTNRGPRAEWEGRYRLSDRSAGEADFFITGDKSDTRPRPTRWAFQLEQVQELPWSVESKLRIREVGDNLYPTTFPDDIAGRGELNLASNFILSVPSPHVSGLVSAKRYRNLIALGENNRLEATALDPKTVQLFPQILLTTNDQFLFGLPFAFGVEARASNFVRPAGHFDYDLSSTDGAAFQPGVDPVREAIRYSIFPKVYTTLRPWDLFHIVPSLEYRTYFYDFHAALPPLNRGYLLFKTELGFQLEKIYDFPSSENFSRVKHLIRPTLTYARIPYNREPSHPFITQVENQNGYHFDNHDVVPLGAENSLVNYFVPQGHSLTYGVLTQLIRKKRPEEESAIAGGLYERFVEASVSQTMNFLEFDKGETERIPFSRLDATLFMGFSRFTSSTTYNFYPYLARYPANQVPDRPSPHAVTTSLGVIFERGLRNDIMMFDRSIALTYTWNRVNSITSSLGAQLNFSINDYWLPVAGANYSFLSHRFAEANLGLVHQNPSRCWRISAGLTRRQDRPGVEFSFDLTLNLTGSGYAGFGDTAEGIVTPGGSS